MDYLFQGQTLLTSIGPGDLSTVESMESAFTGVGAPNPVVFNTTGWKLNNVINVKNFEKAFDKMKCSSCDFSGISISTSTTNTQEMFADYDGPAWINLASIDMSEVVSSRAMF